MQMPMKEFAGLGRVWRGLLIAVACTGSIFAYGQSSDGSITGRTEANRAVLLTSLDTGAMRQMKTDAAGVFGFAKLPPGRYELTSGEFKRVVSVVAGGGIHVALVDGDRLEVIAERTGSAIDFSSVESTTVFTDEEIRALPIARDPNAIALLAPGVVQGDPNFGGLPSFGGASVAENGYYINGFDVTNIRNFLSYATLPFEAISQQQIKTGGYGAEYGRSLGGVISLVTKRGTNEWKNGVAADWSPQTFKARGKNVFDREPTRAGTYTVFNRDSTSTQLAYNLFAGGPIIKDKLFVFALAELRSDKSVSYGQSNAGRSESSQPNGLLKLDFQPTSSHLFELTALSNKQSADAFDYTNARPYSTTLDGPSRKSSSQSGGAVYIVKYTNYLTDSLTWTALLGRVDHLRSKVSGARTIGTDCPVVLDVNLSQLGCWIGPFPGGGGRDPAAPDDTDKRRAGRIDVEWALPKHTIRLGVDAQRFTSAEAGGSAYTGGIYWRYFVTPASGTINGVANAAAPGTLYARSRVSQNTSGRYAVENAAWYLEDNWAVTPNWLLYGGVRSEAFDNKNGDGVSFVKKDNMLAPRLGFSWNALGDSTLKVYGNAGTYFIPVASNTNIRSTRGELFVQRFYAYASRDPRTQAPTGLSAQIGQPQIISDGKLPNPATIADTSLRPMSQNEYILGVQWVPTKNWTFGAKGVYRSIRNGLDDFCGTHGVLERWAADNRYTNFDSSTAANCILLNPGRDVSLQVDVGNNGTLQNVTIPARYFALAPYQRKYQAIELSLQRPWDGRFMLQGSYVWSKSRGTAEGYVNSIVNQDDAGITQDFDFASFTDGAHGYLPNDRRHQIKLFGAMAVTQELRVGLNVSASSGRPKSCIGFVPPTVSDFNEGSRNYTTPSSFYCLAANGVPQLVPRGSLGRTPWTNTISAQLSYTPQFAKKRLTLQLDVFDILNSQSVIETNEVRDFSRDGSNSVPGILSQNYGAPTSFQSPRSGRFSIRYLF